MFFQRFSCFDYLEKEIAKIALFGRLNILYWSNDRVRAYNQQLFV